MEVYRKGLLLGEFPFYKDSSVQKSHNFEGKIMFSPVASVEKRPLMSYFSEAVDTSIEQTIMSSFDFLNFSPEEKKQLSNRHRKMLNSYRHINPFALNVDAKVLVDQINKCKSDVLVIEASDYGAYICLAAIYSGKLSSTKKLEFHFAGSPLALFPESLLKNAPKKLQHKIIFQVTESCWLSPFKSLYANQQIKCLYHRKAA